MNQRMDYTSDSLSIEKPGASFRPYFGLFTDIALAENYNFHLGLYYASKSFDMFVKKENDRKVKNDYRLQYLQIPTLLKLYTNEVALDKKLYFQIGPVTEIKIFDERKETEPVINKFAALDISLNITLGMEMNIGLETAFFAGLTYQRGLLNNVNKTSNAVSDMSLRNDFIGIETGIKF